MMRELEDILKDYDCISLDECLDKDDLLEIARKLGFPIDKRPNGSVQQLRNAIYDWFEQKKKNNYIHNDKNDNWEEARKKILNKYPQYSKILHLTEYFPKPTMEDIEISTNFIGRKQECEDIIQEFEDTSSETVYSIEGIGGIGKSEIAKYIAKYFEEKDFFEDGYIWLSLEKIQDEKSILEYIANDAFGIGNFSDIDDIKIQRDIVFILLQKLNPLIILDNADDIEIFNLAYTICKASKGSNSTNNILITSRIECPPAQVIEKLDELSFKNSIELYSKIFCKKNRENLKEFREDYKKELVHIAEILAGHPLSIEIVSSFGWYPDRVVKELDNKGINVIKSKNRTADERQRDMNGIFDFALEQELDKYHNINKEIKILFTLCGTLSGIRFTTKDIIDVIPVYLNEYHNKLESYRNSVKTKSFLEYIKNSTLSNKGVVQLDSLVNNQEMAQDIIDHFVSINLLKREKVKGREPQYYLHPLVREYSLKNLSNYLSEIIWTSISQWIKSKVEDNSKNMNDFYFFLKVFKEEKLVEEYWSLLKSLKNYSYKKEGKSDILLKYFDEGVIWLKNKKENQSIYAELVYTYGDLLFRIGEEAKAKKYLLEAKQIFKELKDYNYDSWIQYILNFDTDESQLSFLNSLRNHRFLIENKLSFTLGSELSLMSRKIDFILDYKLFNRLKKDDISISINLDSIGNFNLSLLYLIERYISFQKFDLAKKLLEWVKKFHQIDFDKSINQDYNENYFYFFLYQNKLDLAKKYFNHYIEDEQQLKKESDIKAISFMEGLINLKENQYDDALKNFINSIDKDDEDFSFLLLTQVLTSKKITEIEQKKLLKPTTSIKSKDVALNKASIAIYNIIFNDKKNQEDLKIYANAYNFLKENNSIYTIWLDLVEDNIRQTIGEEEFWKVRLNKNRNYEIFKPTIQLIPENLPKIITSQKDGKLMKHIYHGLCPLEKNEFSDLKEIWLSQYYIDVHPVTNREYIEFLKDSSYEVPTEWKEKELESFTDDYPVRNISYKDAQAYAKWAGKVIPNAFELKRAFLLEVDKIDDEVKELDIDEIKELDIDEINGWLESYYNKLTFNPLPSPTEEEVQETILKESYLDSLSWEYTNLTAQEVLKSNKFSKEFLDKFLTLLYISINLSANEKKYIIERFNKFSDSEIEQIFIELKEEKKDLKQVDLNSIQVHINAQQEKWKTILKKEEEIEDTVIVDVFSFAPKSLNDFFPEDFNLVEYIPKEISEEKITTYIYNVFTSPVDSSLKIESINQIKNGQINDQILEAKENLIKEKKTLSKKLIILDITLQQQNEVAKYIMDICKNGTLIEVQQSTEEEKSNENYVENAFANPKVWNSVFEKEIKASDIIDEHPKINFDENLFLDLMSISVSLSEDEKKRIIEAIPKLTQFQIDDLIRILTEEGTKFRQLDTKHNNELMELALKHQESWRSLMGYFIHKNDLDNSIIKDESIEYQRYLKGEFSKSNQWKFFLNKEMKTTDIILEHPNTTFDENLFLNLLSGLLSISKTDKIQIINSLSGFTQEQIDELINISLLEVKKFRELPSNQNQELKERYIQAWKEWKEIIALWIEEKKLDNSIDETIKPIHLHSLDEMKENIIKSKDNSNSFQMDNETLKSFETISLNYNIEMFHNSINAFNKSKQWNYFIEKQIDTKNIIPKYSEHIFDKELFLNLMMGSISLTGEEKKRIIEAIPRLTQFQIDELIRILTEEKEKFTLLESKHNNQLMELSLKHIDTWQELIYSLFPLDELFYSMDVSSENFSFYTHEIAHWTSTQSDNRRPTIIKKMIPQYSNEKHSYIMGEVEDDEVKSNLIGFRCCIPIYSDEDVQKLARKLS